MTNFEICKDANGANVSLIITGRIRFCPMSHFKFILIAIALVIFSLPGFAEGDALELLANGRMSDAIASLQSQTQANPKDATAFHLLARAYYALEKWDEAITAAQKSVALDSKSSDYHLWLGRSYGNKAEHSSWLTALRLAKKTRAEFETAVELNHANVNARSDLAEYYMEAPGFLGGGDDKARAQAEQIAAYDTAVAYWIKGRLAEKNNDLVEAEKDYRAAIRISKNPGGEWLDLASFYRRTGRYQEMDDAINKAVSIEDKNKANIWFEAASLFYRAGRNFPIAAQFLHKAIDSKQSAEEASTFQAHFLLGQILEKQGNLHAAAGEYRATLAIAGDYRQAKEALKRVER